MKRVIKVTIGTNVVECSRVAVAIAESTVIAKGVSTVVTSSFTECINSSS